jgi:hypothetical protein
MHPRAGWDCGMRIVKEFIGNPQSQIRNDAGYFTLMMGGAT